MLITAVKVKLGSCREMNLEVQSADDQQNWVFGHLNCPLLRRHNCTAKHTHFPEPRLTVLSLALVFNHSRYTTPTDVSTGFAFLQNQRLFYSKIPHSALVETGWQKDSEKSQAGLLFDLT